MKINLREWRDSIRHTEQLSAMAKLVGYTLSTYAEHDGEFATPGYEQLGMDIGRSAITVGRAIKELRASGHISEAHKGHSFGVGSSCGVFTTHRLEMPSG
ncbi:helix-turn-helix domain-containing protein [Arthrobacter sp. FW306-2-2C-D06B]|uniref:helix-turn-helix domain-containing protein n=1 Tax=Arthrobacter sp. FW306-2-2C-D06B TaxID=2879618 RepID=UPI001F1D11E3|nr:helix-turn-helix domain-containing protein [Arthrobacter sp. FW306-2-2C-D06B]UKA59202.1 helix-turn-helix domain-containing protein [Arthrobacter sp. FW306-2-2C-D06B]